ncbi:nitrous oxide-stimulated promoter family protein [Chloroflexota bacterium]
MHPRIKRESKTVRKMIALYCRKHHSSDGLCPECFSLMEYTHQRLERCPFQEGKTTCAKCPMHCYEPNMRDNIKAVMRYSGPRMLYRHPISAIRHLLDGRRQEPTHLSGCH